MQTTFDSPPRFMLPGKLVGFQLKRKPLLPSACHSCEISPQNCSEKSFVAAAAPPEQARVLWTAGEEVTPASLPTAPSSLSQWTFSPRVNKRNSLVWDVVFFAFFCYCCLFVLFCFFFPWRRGDFPCLMQFNI